MEQPQQKKLIVSVSPHIRSGNTTKGIMTDVIIALCPAALASIVLFGISSLYVITLCIATAVLSEWLFNLACKRKNTIGDLSAIVTGLLLAMNLPASIPLWQAAVGSAFAIVAVKCLFGGLGKNFANPAITARVMMLIAFTESMTAVTTQNAGLSTLFTPAVVDTAASATPLAVLGGQSGTLPKLMDMLLGFRSGALGETCIIALLIGGVYLLIRKVITWHTPVVFIGTVFVLSWIIYGNIANAAYAVMGGGLVLGAIFMATDYVTTPTTSWGKVVFGLGCGLLTVAIRRFASYPEGVSFSILIMNILTPYIEKLTMKKPLGGAKA